MDVMEKQAGKISLQAHRCPYCHEQCGAEDEHVVCQDCLVRHHTACWDESGRCAGCGGTVRMEPTGERLRLTWPLAREALLATGWAPDQVEALRLELAGEEAASSAWEGVLPESPFERFKRRLEDGKVRYVWAAHPAYWGGVIFMALLFAVFVISIPLAIYYLFKQLHLIRQGARVEFGEEVLGMYTDEGEWETFRRQDIRAVEAKKSTIRFKTAMGKRSLFNFDYSGAGPAELAWLAERIEAWRQLDAGGEV